MTRPQIWAFGASILGEILAWRISESGVERRYLTGACLCLAFGALVSLAWEGLAAFRDRQRRRGEGARRGAFLTVFFILGLVRLFQVQEVCELELALSEAGSLETVCVGEIREITETEYGYSLLIAVESLWVEEETAEERLETGGGTICWYVSSREDLYAGDVVWVSGSVQLYAEATNPGQFDVRAYYRAQGRIARGSVKELRLLSRSTFSLRRLLEKLRLSFAEALCLAGDRLGLTQADIGLLRAVALGEKGELFTEDKELFRLAGLSHILSISGLHIGMLGSGLYRFLKKRLGAPAGASAFLAGLFILLYARMTATGPASVRALLMFLFFLYSQRRGCLYDAPSAAAVAGLLLLLEHPLQLFQAGFQLSFSAMAGVCLVLPVLRDWWQNTSLTRLPPAEEALLFGMTMQLTSLPALLWHYYEYPLLGFLVNLLAVPLLGLLLGCSLLSAVAGLAAPLVSTVLLAPAALVISWYRVLAEVVQELPGTTFLTGQPLGSRLLSGLFLWLLGLMLCYRLCEKRKREQEEFERLPRLGKRLGRGGLLLLVLGFSLFFWKRPVVAGLQITALDVGQGDAFIVQTETGTVFAIDGGSSSVSEVGSRRILTYLKWCGIAQVDFVILSHLDEDHTNGWEELLAEGVSIGALFLSCATTDEEELAAWELLAEEAGTRLQLMTAGDCYQEGELTLLCLYPAQEERVSDENDASLVLLLKYGAFQMLFTGDLTSQKEETLLALLKENGMGESLTVLKVAHHGSRYSTGEALLAFLSPSLSLISCGEGNSYGHPHEALLERLLACASEILVTAQTGAVTLETDGRSWRVACYVSGEGDGGEE